MAMCVNKMIHMINIAPRNQIEKRIYYKKKRPGKRRRKIDMNTVAIYLSPRIGLSTNMIISHSNAAIPIMQ